MSETPMPMAGVWTLIAPDGRTWKAPSPILACQEEQRERIPPCVALQRIHDAMNEESQLERELAQARAECENLRQEMREYEHHVMTGRNEQHDRLVAETERLRAELEAVRSLLDDAADDIQDWGCYASEYFREKHDLMGCINKYRDAARSKP